MPTTVPNLTYLRYSYGERKKTGVLLTIHTSRDSGMEDSNYGVLSQRYQSDQTPSANQRV